MMEEFINISSSYLSNNKRNCLNGYISLDNLSIIDHTNDFNDNILLCRYCASFFHQFIKVDNNVNEFSWICSFCKKQNDNSKSQNSNLDNNNSYQVQQFNYISSTSNTTTNLFHNNLLNENIYSFALGSDIISQTSVQSLLLEIITSLPANSRICFIIYNRSVNILSLSDLISKSGYLSYDSLPGYKYDECLWEKKLLSNKYICTKEIINSKYSLIVSALNTLASNDYNKQTCDGICTISVILSFLSLMKQFSQCKGIEFLSFNTRSYVLGNLSSHPWNLSNSIFDDSYGFKTLGNLARKNCIRIGIICSGLHGIYYDKLVSLCYSSGGRIISNSSSFNDDNVITNIKSYINKTINLPNYNNISIDIRTENIINISAISFGCNDYDINSNSGGLVNINDLSYVKLSNEKEIFKSLTGLNEVTDMSANIRNNPLYNAYVVNDIIPYDGLKLILEFELDDKSNINNDNHITYIQIILRYNIINNDGTIHNIIKIITFPITITNDITNIIENLNYNSYIYCLSNILVSLYHNLIHRSYHGAKNKLIKTEYNMTDILLNDINQLVILLLNFILNYKNNSKHNIIIKYCNILRMLYHLKEGLLIDNNITNPQESYLLRSYFLSSSPLTHSITFILPKLQLLILDNKTNYNIILHDCIDKVINYLSNENWKDNNILDYLIDIEPCTTSLLFNSIIILECGDVTVIRPSFGLDINSIYQGILITDIIQILHKALIKKYEYYQPIPRIMILGFSDIIKPYDRLLLSRLSPTHRDSSDIIVLSSQYYNTMSIENKTSLIDILPYTDQDSFYSYIQKLNPIGCQLLFHFNILSDKPIKSLSMDNRKIDMKSVTKNINITLNQKTTPLKSNFSILPISNNINDVNANMKSINEDFI